MRKPKARAIDGFLRRAAEEICQGNFDEAGYLYGEAQDFYRMTDYEFEMHYMKDVLDV